MKCYFKFSWTFCFPFDFMKLDKILDLSKFLTPANESKLEIKVDFTFKSMGASQSNAGVKLISINQGFNSESIKISNPNSSNQLFL